MQHAVTPETAATVTESGPSKEQGDIAHAVLGWFCNLFSLLFLPILAIGGIILGALHIKYNAFHGIVIIFAAIVCGIAGILYGLASLIF